MAEDNSPTIARRRVRLAIREAREAAGLTQAQVAEAMDWSVSKAIRIENGDVSISANDVRNVLLLLNVDRALVNALVADARIARKRTRPKSAWWLDKRFTEHLSEHLRQFVEYEAEASEIRSFNIFYIPGLLQTPEYSDALTSTWIAEATEEPFTQEKVAALVESRRLRQNSLLERKASLQAYFLLDQSVLERPFGGPAVFAKQLRRVVELSEHIHIHLRMLPFQPAIAIANNGAFDLMTIGNPDDGEVMYRENGMADEVVEKRADTRRHRHRFDQLWGAAADETDTIVFIKQQIERFEETPQQR